MEYIELVLSLDEKYHDFVISEMLDIGFDGFEQKDHLLKAYIVKEHFRLADREIVEQLLLALPGDHFIASEEVIPEKNWNKIWENSIHPRRIGKFLVIPSWEQEEEVEEGLIPLKIDPKMSFGTGYHASTEIMLHALADTVKQGFQVLDVGTGTGILSIASVKLGADRALAVDIDHWSIENATENSRLNNLAGAIEIIMGSIDVVPVDNRYELVLANINRNAIFELMPGLVSHVKSGGYLILSGFLGRDSDAIRNHDKLHHFDHIKTYRKEDWIALKLRKTVLS